ncbi:MAG: carbohydrate kinase family protein [Dysgonamonadaceae bacterium]|jgi:sugar/nucleoside kinase (ribokinase family)|nr:carbohydrate kinase family protein [Dysgonamonadaceae bacterium]
MKEHGSFDVVCIGLLAADILVKPVDRKIFDVDSTRIPSIGFSPGGDAVNESMTLSKLGFNVSLAAKVGTDIFGDAVLRKIKEKEVDISFIKPLKDIVTCTSIILINEHGDRSFVFCAGNNDSLTINDVDMAVVRGAKVVSIGSLCALAGLDGEGSETIFREAKKHGVITVADTNIDFRGIGLTGIAETLKHTDFFIPSYGEAVLLTGEKDPEKIADRLLETSVKNVVVKMGAKGCLIANSKERFTLPTYDVKVIDTTGCGDNFVSGFITALIKGWDLRRAGLFANAMGSLNSMNIGACTVNKTVDEVLEFMETMPFFNG